jgi:chromosome segregation ATPase
LARGKIEELETEIQIMEERLSPMDARLAELRGELEEIKERIEAARTACQGQDKRAMAAALSRVLGRIVCTFEHYQTIPKKKQTKRQKSRPQGQDRSRLVSAFFEPLRGEGRELRAEGCGSAQR